MAEAKNVALGIVGFAVVVLGAYATFKGTENFVLYTAITGLSALTFAYFGNTGVFFWTIIMYAFMKNVNGTANLPILGLMIGGAVAIAHSLGKIDTSKPLLQINIKGGDRHE